MEEGRNREVNPEFGQRKLKKNCILTNVLSGLRVTRAAGCSVMSCAEEASGGKWSKGNVWVCLVSSVNLRNLCIEEPFFGSKINIYVEMFIYEEGSKNKKKKMLQNIKIQNLINIFYSALGEKELDSKITIYCFNCSKSKTYLSLVRDIVGHC
uniref:Uncharacterized protein n=1 Tax=Strigamia maritima TaxID=126957 RepID=T1J4L5_STRMM